MKQSSLSAQANKLIDHYFNISLGKHTIPCPYFNNKKMKVRAGLRVAVGKGSVTEIEEELSLVALREKVDLSALNKKEITQFATDHNIGIECSGFVYYVLSEELKATKNTSLKKHIRPLSKNPLRRTLASLRPAENTNVATLISDKNTKDILLKEVQAGDLILMMGTGEKHDLNHVLLISKVEYKNNVPKTIEYVHSLQWKTDGIYHGVRRGTITITNIKKPLATQTWVERKKSGDDNETLYRVKTAEMVKIGRVLV